MTVLFHVLCDCLSSYPLPSSLPPFLPLPPPLSLPPSTPLSLPPSTPLSLPPSTPLSLPPSTPLPLPPSLEQVRAKAVDTLVAVYKTVGERVRTDLNKRGIPQSRLGPILAKFDEALANGAVTSEVSCWHFFHCMYTESIQPH